MATKQHDSVAPAYVTSGELGTTMMLVSGDFPEIGASPSDTVAVIQVALVESFGGDAGRVAQQQLARGQHDPQMAILWASVNDGLSG